MGGYTYTYALGSPLYAGISNSSFLFLFETWRPNFRVHRGAPDCVHKINTNIQIFLLSTIDFRRGNSICKTRRPWRTLSTLCYTEISDLTPRRQCSEGGLFSR